MRKVLAIVLTALVLVGCNDKRPIDDMNKIGFTSQVPRSLIQNVSDLQKEELKLYASYTLDGRSARVFNAERLYYNRQIPGWDYDIPQYWMMGAAYNFYAVCPYSVNCSFSEALNTVAVTDYESSTAGVDLLYATATRDNTEDDDFSTVMLGFHHACAAVEFNIVNASNSTLIDVRNVRIVGLYNKGTLHISSDGKATWTLASQTVQSNATVQPFAGTCVLPEGGLPVNLTVEHPLYENGAVVVLPQTIYKSTATLHLEYKKASDSEYAVRDIQLGMLGGTTPTEWKAGSRYKYNLNITDNTITTEVRVVDWIDNYVDL